jgi:hypothetical protein
MSHKDKPNYRQILEGVKQAGNIATYARAINKPRKTVSGWHKEALDWLGKEATKHKREEFDTKTYIITSAQIGTKVHEGFLKNLELLAETHNAEIMIPGITYNVDSEWEGGLGDAEKKVKSQYFSSSIRKYLMNDNILLNSKIQVLGKLNILPTAVNPLSGYQTFTGEKSAILPHPKVALESVATRPGKLAKMLMTTGSVTVPNFIQKNAGIKGEFHHQLGAVLVEVCTDKQFHYRHVLGDEEGNFYDMTDKYENGIHTTGHRVDAIVWGDIHLEDLDLKVAGANWGEGSLSDMLKPRYQFFHDLLDFKYRNHHNRDNDAFMKRMLNESVKKEILNCGRFLDTVSMKDCKSIVVKSNHDSAFDRWVNEVSHFDEPNPDNALFLLECQVKKAKAARDGWGSYDIFREVVMTLPKMKNAKPVTFLKQDQSYMVNGVECGMHGDAGINGSKGSPKSFTKIGVKCNTGHTHTCGIIEGVYTAGCCRTLQAGYSRGPSSWSQTQIIQYANGKRTLLTCVNQHYYDQPFPMAQL